MGEGGSGELSAFPALGADAGVGDALDRLFMNMIVVRYDADIAFSCAQSIRRNIGRGLWRPVAYSFPPPSRLRADSMASVYRRLRAPGRIDAEIVSTALRLPNFSVPFRDLRGDAEKIRVRVEQLMRDALAGPPPVALDVVEAGFFRDRSAFIVGRWLLTDDRIVPFVVALLNSPHGIYADAVLHRV